MASVQTREDIAGGSSANIQPVVSVDQLKSLRQACYTKTKKFNVIQVQVGISSSVQGRGSCKNVCGVVQFGWSNEMIQLFDNYLHYLFGIFPLIYLLAALLHFRLYTFAG